MTSPSKPTNEPYSSHDGTNFNLKPRVLKCPMCKYEIVTDLAAARCGDCNSKLITLVIFDDMAGRNSSAT